jgi:hypothetical protein
VDFRTNSPHATYRALLPEFKRRYGVIRYLNYGGNHTASRYAELNHDTESMRGYAGRGISFKIYERTNRRVRLGVEYKWAGLEAIGAPISLFVGDELCTLRNFLSGDCPPEINAISQNNSSCAHNNWSVY